MDSISKPTIAQLLKPTDKESKVSKVADSYVKYYEGSEQTKDKAVERKANFQELASSYYDLATDFFEYGWGESFHFATMAKGESREHAFAKHEYRLAVKLGLKAGDVALDLGCGVGGPARHIAALTEAKIVGLNYNNYQIKRCNQLTRRANLDHLCSYVQGDFCHAPFPNESFSKVYAIEATCHAADLSEVYGEVFRLLKPGGLFACYEWILTDKYNPDDPYHRKIKADILEGDGLPELNSKAVVHKSLESVGFDILEAENLALKSPIPWQSVLEPRWTLSDLKITPLGRWITHASLVTMETVGLAPKGSCKVHTMLCKGADGLVLGGKTGIFTPMYMFVARKPGNSK